MSRQIVSPEFCATVSADLKNCTGNASDSPLPLLVFLYRQREQSLEEQQQYRGREVPVERVAFEYRHLPDGQNPVRREDQARQDRLKDRQKRSHFSTRGSWRSKRET